MTPAHPTGWQRASQEVLLPCAAWLVPSVTSNPPGSPLGE